MTNPVNTPSLGLRDRPARGRKPAYLAGFAGGFCAAFLCGSGGVESIRRSTSSGDGGGFGLSFIGDVP